MNLFKKKKSFENATIILYHQGTRGMEPSYLAG
jgi:hypothetical protein